MNLNNPWVYEELAKPENNSYLQDELIDGAMGTGQWHEKPVPWGQVSGMRIHHSCYFILETWRNMETGSLLAKRRSRAPVS